MLKPDPQLEPPVRWLRVLFLSLWVAMGIGMASLKWDWSIDFVLSADVDYEFRDNTLQQQRTGLNRWLIFGYSSLAMLGVVGVALHGSAALPRFQMWHIFPLALLLWCGASLMWSVEPALTVRRLGHLYMSVLGGLGIVTMLNRREILWALVTIFGSLCWIGIVAELSLGMFQPWRSGYRFCGVGHPNETALFAVTVILSGRILWLQDRRSRLDTIFSSKNLAILCMVLCAILLFLTKSRTAMLSGLVALIVIQYVHSQSFNGWIFVTGLTSLGLLVGLFLAVVPTSVYNAFFGIATVGRSTHVASLTGRIPLWELILQHWQREPLLGYGYGGYWTTRRVEDFAQIFYWEPPNGHSIYVDSLVETGPVGLSLLVLSLVSMLLAGLYSYARSKHTSLLFVIGASCLMLVHGLAESSFYKGCYGPLMVALTAFILVQKSSSSRAVAAHATSLRLSELPS